ncbi:MAG: hypothetical protein RL259_580 [Bacteroidota bacterium]|jgi:hypothetical protein
MAFEARTTQEIINDFVSLIQADATIYDVNSDDETKLSNPSNASVWYNLAGLFGVEVGILESEFEDLVSDIEARKLEIPVGTLRWYADESLNYQFGDTLILVNGVPQYPIVDTTKQVVKLASATTQEGIVLIKAAKLNISNLPEKLSVSELSGLTDYWTNKRFAGTSLTIISQDGDELSVTARIEVDGQLISSTGESLTTPGTYPVEDAIRNYIAELDFNGRFKVMSLVDAIQSVAGVENVVVSQALALSFGSTLPVNITNATDRAYTAVAGYMIESTTTPFSTTLTYVV